jgi:hypothetical protein
MGRSRRSTQGGDGREQMALASPLVLRLNGGSFIGITIADANLRIFP